jgi:type IX secretion system PorP/SprF family membrane protein
MRYFKNTLTIVTFFLIGSLYAQQEPNYSLYRYSMNIINPAYTGADGETSLFANFRSQWVDVQDAPETQSFFFATPVGKRVGLGTSIVSDQTFIETQTTFMIDFSYQLPLSEGTNLYLGLKAGGSTYNINRGKLAELPYFGEDPALGNIDTDFKPNVGVGGYLMNEKYFLSLSMPNLLISESINLNDGRVTYATDKTHIYLSGGYNFSLSDSVEFRPYTMIRYVGGSPLSVDINAAFRFFSKLELGAAYRTDEAFTGLFILDLADWASLGYAYDSSTRSELSGVSDGTHEILFRLNL